MSFEDKELIRLLMAKATELLEDAHGAAVSGQASGLSAAEHLRAARRVAEKSAQIQQLSICAEFLAEPAQSGQETASE